MNRYDVCFGLYKEGEEEWFAYDTRIIYAESLLEVVQTLAASPFKELVSLYHTVKIEIEAKTEDEHVGHLSPQQIILVQNKAKYL